MNEMKRTNNTPKRRRAAGSAKLGIFVSRLVKESKPMIKICIPFVLRDVR